MLPATLKVETDDDLAIVIEGTCAGPVVLTEAFAVIVAPLGALALPVALLRIKPRSKSACVTR